MPREKTAGSRRQGAGGKRKRVSLRDDSASSLIQPPTNKPQQLPSVAVVGAGRLGTALARALAACGYEVVAVVARRATSARRAAALVSPHTRALSAAQLSQLPPVNLLLITTPDGRIAETAARIADAAEEKGKRKKGKGKEVKGVTNEGASDAASEAPSLSSSAPSSTASSGVAAGPRVALHASGALSSDVLAPLREVGFAVGSMHPLVSVSEPAGGAESLRRAFFCVEGDARALRAARALVGALGGHSFTIDTRDKSLYHAAAVMTSGHTVALFDLASGLLARCGLPRARARRVLLPLLESTLANLSAQEPSRALTGSFARADVSTVRRHLAALDAIPAGDDAAARDVYALLGRHSLRLAAEAGADARSLEVIARALAEILDSR